MIYFRIITGFNYGILITGLGDDIFWDYYRILVTGLGDELFLIQDYYRILVMGF